MLLFLVVLVPCSVSTKGDARNYENDGETGDNQQKLSH